MKTLAGTLFVMVALLTGSAARAQSGMLDVMTGAVLVGRSDVDDVHAFPEMAATAEGRAVARTAPMVSRHAQDAAYESPLPYGDTVRYFDDQFARRRMRIMARTVTQTATAWTVRRPDGTVASIIARTTQPKATFEIAQVVND
jgi:hypothetical protein